MTESRVKIVLLMIKVYVLMSNIIQVFYFNEVYFGVKSSIMLQSNFTPKLD